MSLNHHAQALGKLGKGKRKTMSIVALEQRKLAAKQSQLARRLRISSDKLKITIDTTETLS